MQLINFTESHFQTLTSWFNLEKELIQWGGNKLSYPLSHEALLQMLTEDNLPQPTRLSWMVTDKNHIVGHCQLALDWKNGNAVLGRIAIAPKFRGTGLAVPMVRLAVREGFSIPQMERIELNVYTINLAAIRTYEKVGFLREGIKRSEAKVDGARWDTLMMSILRSEWTEG